MKFCCERFETYHKFPSYHGPNIRVVKYPPEELLDKDHLYRFYICYNYDEGQKSIPHMNIAYCPFCGTHLFKYYQNDKYVNEVSSTFNL